MEKNQKIAVIGTGLVGSSCAYALVNQEVCHELYLININNRRAEGKAWDIAQGNVFMPKRTKITAADYSICGELDVIVFTAGAP